MSEETKIEWATGTFNPWEGCTKVSPGCAHCYAEARNHRFGNDNWGKGKLRRRTSQANWKKPVKWNRSGICPLCDTAADHEHRHGSIIPAIQRQRIFPSLCDWLDEEVPIEWLADFLKLIHDTPNLDWLLLTKRPEKFEARMQAILSPRDYGSLTQVYAANWLMGHLHRPPANVWIGTSVEDQQRADERIPELLKIPAKVRFLSVEPLLGPVDLESPKLLPLYTEKGPSGHGSGIDWVIVGGESGPGARPCNIEWIRSIVAQCKAAGVPCFVKQLGRDPTWSERDIAERWYERFSHKKGGDPSEWPEDLRVRQFPKPNLTPCPP